MTKGNDFFNFLDIILGIQDNLNLEKLFFDWRFVLFTEITTDLVLNRTYKIIALYTSLFKVKRNSGFVKEFRIIMQTNAIGKV